MLLTLYLCSLVLILLSSTGSSSAVSNQTQGSSLDGGLSYSLIRQLIDDYNTLKQSHEISQQKISTLEQEMGNLHQTSTQRYLTAEKEIQTLKQEILQLKQYNVTAEKNIQDLKQSVVLLKQENQKLKNISSSVDGLQTEFRYISLSLLDVSKQTSNISTELSLSTKNMKTVQDQLHALRLFRSNISSVISSLQKKIAFTAAITSTTTSGYGLSTVVFPSVIYNTGGGYNSRTGIFIAPVTGDYVFFVTAVSYYGRTLYLDIIVNGQAKVGTMSEDSSSSLYQTGTNLVVYRLQHGDKVWVGRWSGDSIYTYSDHPLTTFSGFLL